MAEIIEYFGQSSDARNCGYCKQKGESECTYGMWAHELSSRSYQILMDRNWRRSGKYCYKPINDRVCCPMYTIRCDALNFKLKKSHKKVIKHFNNFIKSDTRSSTTFKGNSAKEEVTGDDFRECSEKVNKFASPVNVVALDTADNVNVANTKPKDTVENVTTKTVNPSVCPDGTKTNKKKFMRRQKLIQKVMKRENCSELEAKEILFKRSCQKQKTKSLEDFLSECNNCAQPKHVFQKNFVPVTSNNKNAFDESYKVFYKYQKNIHKEGDNKISQSGFKRFLVDSPLKYESNDIPASQDTGLVRYFGSFHQNYYIDGRLVAVAVLDILPNCVSSVYLFYDHEFSFLNLGVYSALNEIALVRKLNKFLPDLKYYYMGFYIHSCPKMRYKAQFLPADLLCSETFRWFNIESCVSKLSNQKYSRFCDDPQMKDDDGNVDDKDLIIFNGKELGNLVNYQSKHTLSQSSLNLIREFGRLVGKRCAPKLVYYSS